MDLAVDSCFGILLLLFPFMRNEILSVPISTRRGLSSLSFKGRPQGQKKKKNLHFKRTLLVYGPKPLLLLCYASMLKS